ncbi:MAG: anthranilate phosphoribosyltransferase [Solirubrobacteraceae bacterium]
MKDILEKLYQYQTLSQKEAYLVLSNITQGIYSEIELASFVTIFNMRTITIEELKGFRAAMLDLAININLSEYEAIDIVGTGGDGKNTFNISTLSSFVVAACGYKVIKHGSYGSSSVSGSSNMLEYFGYTFSNKVDELKKELDQVGLCFLHAPLFHPAMKNIALVRKSLKVKTFFNILGPLINPAQPKYQLLGTFNQQTARLYHNLLEELGKTYTVITSLDGYDEVSLTSDVKVYSNVGEKQLTTLDFGIKNKLNFKDIEGGKTIEENAKIFLSIVEGKGTTNQNQVVIANSALAIQSINPSKSLLICLEEAKESLHNKKVLSIFKKCINS